VLVQEQPYAITHHEFQLTMMLVVSRLQKVLSLEQSIFDLCKERVFVPQLAINDHHPRLPRLEGIIRGGMRPYTTWIGVAFSVVWCVVL
jgi:hypothetical protein